MMQLFKIIRQLIIQQISFFFNIFINIFKLSIILSFRLIVNF